MKVVLLGKGVISEALATVLRPSCEFSAYSVRAICDNTVRLDKVLEDCMSAQVVVYIGFHRARSFFNFRLLHSVVTGLAVGRWPGLLVFVNSQSTLGTALYPGAQSALSPVRFDPYVFTKRVQTGILARFGGGLRILDLYLPVVLGTGTSWQKRLDVIASHRVIGLPPEGRGRFAYLHTAALSAWFERMLGNESTARGHKRLFLFEDLVGIHEYLKRRCAALGFRDTVFKSLQYKYRYAPSLVRNVVWQLKLSIAGTAARAIAGLLHLRRSGRAAPGGKIAGGSADSPRPESIELVGPEYDFFASSVEPARLPFEAERLGH